MPDFLEWKELLHSNESCMHTGSKFGYCGPGPDHCDCVGCTGKIVLFSENWMSGLQQFNNISSS